MNKIFLLAAMIVIVAFLWGCSPKIEDVDYQQLATDYANLFPNEVDSDFLIPEHTKKITDEGAEVTILSSHPDVLSEEGKVNRPFSDQVVVFEIRISKGERSFLHTINITVKGHGIVTLTVGDALAFLLSLDYEPEITDALILPQLPSEYEGFLVSWVGNNENIYMNGTYSRPKFDAELTMTALVTKGDASGTVDFQFMVKGTRGPEKTIQDAFLFFDDVIPDIVEDEWAFPDLDQDFEDFIVEVESSDEEVFAEGIYRKPIVDTEFILEITIWKNDHVLTKNYLMKAIGLEATERITLAKEAFSMNTLIGRTLFIVENENKYGVVVTISSTNPTVITNEGSIHPQMTDSAVTITYTITADDLSESLVKPVIVAKLSEAERVLKVQEELVINPDFGQKLSYLPATFTKYGANLSWSADPFGYIGNGVFRPGAIETTVILTATITIGSSKGEKAFSVMVRAATPSELVNNISLEINDYLSNPIERSLPVESLNQKYQVDVIIQSSNESLVDNSGIYHRPEYDQPVDISFTYEISGTVYVKEKMNIRVKGPNNQTVMADTLSWLGEFMENVDLATVEKLPDTHPDHYAIIHWYAPSGILSSDGTIVASSEENASQPVKLVATVQYDTLRVIATFYKAAPPKHMGETEQFIEQYLKDIIQRNAEKAFVLVNGNPPSVFTEYITINGYTRTGLQKPEVPQSTLDERMYPGYLMPNSENILWIVVHETDNWGATADAAAHHNYIKGLSNNPNNKTYVSWHYTVDDKSIYQHLPDHETAFHAGDGSRIGGGNKNGIGIEMCVNGLGNFELTIRNTAKLIATLLHKYNLTIDNVKQHFDFSGKNCPSGLRNTNRWNEFLQLVMVEYRAQEILKDKTITWSISQNNHLVLWNDNLAVVANQPVFDTEITVTAGIEINGITKEIPFVVTVRGKFKTIQ